MLPTLKQHIRVNRYSFAQKETFKAKLFFHWKFRDLTGYNPNRTYYTDNYKPKLNKWFDILGLLCMSYMGCVCIHRSNVLVLCYSWFVLCLKMVLYQENDLFWFIVRRQHGTRTNSDIHCEYNVTQLQVYK
jgi:hypothetical protein